MPIVKRCVIVHTDCAIYKHVLTTCYLHDLSILKKKKKAPPQKLHVQHPWGKEVNGVLGVKCVGSAG